MKSAARLLLNKTYKDVWYRGEEYTNTGKVSIVKHTEKDVEGVVHGTKRYVVDLKFAGGGIHRECTCPSSYEVCKHIVAVAILWDRVRNISKPVNEEVESLAIASHLITRSKINALYQDPLHADLEVLRKAAEERGSWSRPHARLPRMPRFSTDEKEPLTIQEGRRAFREIKRWAERRTYDDYFCAGEMVAALCEVLRLIKKRLPAASPLVAAETLCDAQRFQYILTMELIDDSDGLHVFNEAHLDDIYRELTKISVAEQEQGAFGQKLMEFNQHRDDY